MKSPMTRKVDIFVRKDIKSEKAPGAKIEIFEYWSEGYVSRTVKSLSEIDLSKRRPGGILWINIDGFPGSDEVEKLREKFGVHPLVLEDIANPSQRPKSEEYEKHIYIVLKMLSYGAEKKEIHSEQVSIILENGLVISVQELPGGDVFEWVRERIRSGKGKTRKNGADYLVYRLLDSIVENYFLVLEKVGEEIEVLEELLVANPSPKLLTSVYKLKREALFLRKSVWPLREAIRKIESDESPVISEYARTYLREVYDHTIQVIDTVETFLEMLSEMLDTYLSSISNKTNEVVKLLTIITTVFMPLSFLAGLYGMNFKYLPGLSSELGFPIMLFLMVSLSGGMLFYFRKRGWI
ncbi:MAG: magnesium/cobalt transporter CorA [archaeon]